jgi:hypothetical protein
MNETTTETETTPAAEQIETLEEAAEEAAILAEWRDDEWMNEDW